MIEVIYKDEKQETRENEGMFVLPKNIRQIGLPDEGYRIYVEDYVYTFLGRIVSVADAEEESDNCLAVFTGETKWAAGVGYVFIKGAVFLQENEITADHAEFTDTLWQYIQEETERYFGGQEIVGWFFAQRSTGLKVSEALRRAHLKHFGGEKVLMLMDTEEKEEAFFRYENGFMVKQDGYYIYYEKNPQMQLYMMEKNHQLQQDTPEEVQDDAVRTFRKIIRKKQGGNAEETEERTSVFSYAATACLALAVLTVGIQFYQKNDRMEVKEASSKSAVVETISETPKPKEPKEKTLTPTSAVKKDPTKIPISITPTVPVPTEMPAIREIEEKTDATGGEAETISESMEEDKEEDLYREEADTRKAEQRIRQEQDVETKSESASVNGGLSYIIKPGDTLYQISIAQYGTMEMVEKICQLNGIEEDGIIYPGQIIVLP